MKDLLLNPEVRRVPLYRTSNTDLINRTSIPDNANTGLWYDKFPNLWGGQVPNLEFQQTREIEWWPPNANGPKKSKVEIGKLAWIESVTPSWYQPDIKPSGNSDLIAESIERQKALAMVMGGNCVALINESRFVSGLGREHPVENGFAWHHTLGTPYLPGSSLKGMVCAWAKAEEFKERDQLLGSEKSGAGRVILLDMIPAAPVQLVADVMTPHYGPYYDPDKKEAPGDWHSPVPVPFLVCEVNQQWQTAVLPGSRSESPEQFQDDAKLIREWLIEALAWQGAGAKTAVGYGRFNVL